MYLTKSFVPRSAFVLAATAVGFSSQAQVSTGCINQLTGQDCSKGVLNTITTAVPFLMISVDSRAGGMGDAGVATSADANAIHWNPSKLAFAQNDAEFRTSYSPWLHNLVPDMSVMYLSGCKK